ncbi:hypothetical protein [Methanobacterium formicicum]|uniref:hypothetical protein n=1 Tax=Methanobacterium formicicum TaxID=2162 RepID=UPI002412ABE4|nr:hypothetical protein [Methanobacterium formicicum]MDG3548144.1 hypothetical protein [Methanobacterium formicicum]
MEICKTCIETNNVDFINKSRLSDNLISKKKFNNNLMRFVKSSNGDSRYFAVKFGGNESKSQVSLVSELQQIHGNQYVQRLLGAQTKLKKSKPSVRIDSDVIFEGNQYKTNTHHGKKLLINNIQQITTKKSPTRVQRDMASAASNIVQDVKNLFSKDRWKNARECLKRLIPRNKDLTFQVWIPHACKRSRTGFLHSREWDAFGHCWIGCEGTRQCGGPQTWTYGLGYEISRELDRISGKKSHDSFTQDISNQIIGRALSIKEGTCFALCDNAHQHGILNLSAPIRVCTNCSTYPSSGSEGPCPKLVPSPSSSSSSSAKSSDAGTPAEPKDAGTPLPGGVIPPP